MLQDGSLSRFEPPKKQKILNKTKIELILTEILGKKDFFTLLLFEINT
jgi:hypothetical protein